MTLDEKGRRLHGRVEFFDRNVTQLTKHVQQIIGHHQDGVKHGINFSAKIKTVAAQEPFADLQDRLVGLAEITERISLERKNIMIDRARTQVLNKLAEIKKTVISPTQALLQDRDSCVKALLKAQEKATDGQGIGTREETAGATLEHRHQLMNTEATVDNNFELFEAQRVEEIKEILEEFLRCELYYHCRALEVLAPALMHIGGVDAESARMNMREDIEGMNKQLHYT
eukprot:g17918.t1